MFGTASAELDSPIHVIATDFTAELKRGDGGERCIGEMPFGGFAAGAAVAAIALDAARPSVEIATGLTARTPRPSPGPPVRISLQEMFPGLAGGLTLNLDDVDVISGGAITHGVIFCLLRVPGVRGHLRVIEQQHAELSNVNRYPLLRASDDGRLKVEHLESLATTDLEIDGVASLYTKETRETFLPLAKCVLVGVDDVEARWWVQEENPEWLAVAATGNHLAQLTTHVPESPCAACIHHVPLAPQTIPTISFASFWAGLLQACTLISGSRTPRNIVVYPFALGGPSGTEAFPLMTNPECRLGCSAALSGAA
jgi:molybdopterin/thiamine biosynthesis adenylyltransferase